MVITAFWKFTVNQFSKHKNPSFCLYGQVFSVQVMPGVDFLQLLNDHAAVS